MLGRSAAGASRGTRRRLRGSARWPAPGRPAPDPAWRARACSAIIALTCRFTACTAAGLLAAIPSAISSAHGMRRSAGTTRLISPIRAAELASINFGRHQQLHRVDVADDLLDELDGRAAERVDGPPHLGQSEARVRRGGAHVAAEQQLDATAGAIAVHGGHDWLRKLVQLEQRAVDDPRRLRRRGDGPLTSAPALKARSPAPVSTMRRQELLSSSSQRRPSSAIIARVMGFSRG